MNTPLFYNKILENTSQYKNIKHKYKERHYYTLTYFAFVALETCHAVAREARVLVMTRGVVLTRIRRTFIYCCNEG